MSDGSWKPLDVTVHLAAGSDKLSEIAVLAERNEYGRPGYIKLTSKQAVELRDFLNCQLPPPPDAPQADVNHDPAAACRMLPRIIRAMLDGRCDPRPEPHDRSMFSIQSWLCECLSLCASGNPDSQAAGCARIVEANCKVNDP